VPKYKVDRRLGVNLWGRPKSPINKRPSRPGMHGKNMRRKQSNFAVQLREKQILQFYYGMKECQFRRFFVNATKSKSNISDALISSLERRLDTIVYRAKWAATIFGSKQLIKHKHILVNGKVVSISSYLVSAGDVISISDKMKNHKIVLEASVLQEREVPAYIEAQDASSVTLVKVPSFEDVPYPVQVNPQLVVEFYSRKV
jgi:small subunit ribosomal protein S4